MSDKIIRVTKIHNPTLDASFAKAMRGKRMPPPGSAIPKTKAEFDAAVAEAEKDLKPTQRGRPARGTKRAATRSRSIRAPAALWDRLDAAAKAPGPER